GRRAPVRRIGDGGAVAVLVRLVGLPAAPSTTAGQRAVAVRGEQLGDCALAWVVGLGAHPVHRASYVVKRPSRSDASCAERSIWAVPSSVSTCLSPTSVGVRCTSGPAPDGAPGRGRAGDREASEVPTATSAAGWIPRCAPTASGWAAREPRSS